MITVERSVALKAPVADVWKVIGGFGQLGDWHPAVMACRLDQRDERTLRVLTLGDGAQLVEELVPEEGESQRYSYKILSGPLPVADYMATLSVSEKDGGALVHWQGSFNGKGVSDEDAANIIAGVYEAGLANLAKKFS
jgi:hypothetical protein